jgi:signal transduction histidine kinase
VIAHRAPRSDGTRRLTGSILEQRSSPAKTAAEGPALQLRRLLMADIQDRITPSLTAILADMENLKRQPRSSSDVRDHLATYQGELRELLSGVRDLITDLDGEAAKPRDGLAGLLRDRLRDHSERTGIKSRLAVGAGWPSELGFSTSTQIFGIVDGALRNVELHSGASRVGVTLRTAGGELCVMVRDDGRGIGGGHVPGHGILGMRERAVVMGGILSIERPRAGGTTVKLIIPFGERRRG